MPAVARRRVAGLLACFAAFPGPTRIGVAWAAIAWGAVATLSVARPAQGAPQVNLGLTVGGAAANLRTAPAAAFHLGLRADVLFLRSRETEMALGPYVDLATSAFDSVETGGGLEWQTPFVGDFSMIFSGGAFARHTTSFGWEPGIESTVFLGSRSYNFHSWYGLGLGLFAQGRYGLGDGREADLIAGIQFDLSLMAYPFVLIYNAIR